MSSKRTIRLNVSRDTIVGQMAAWLYAVKQFRESEDILDIKFHKLDKDNDLIPIEVTIKEGVDILKF